MDLVLIVIEVPKCNARLVLNVIKFGSKCNKPLVLNIINPLLHLGPNIEALNVMTVPKCSKEPKCKNGVLPKCNINNQYC